MPLGLPEPTLILRLSSDGCSDFRRRSRLNFSARRRFSLNLFRWRFDKSPDMKEIDRRYLNLLSEAIAAQWLTVFQKK